MVILHISDLHLINGIGNAVDCILERFYQFIGENHKGTRFEHLIITGDLRDARNNNGIDINSCCDILEKITKLAGIGDKHRVHIVPGNHDLTRGENDAQTINKIKRKYDVSAGIFNDSDKNTLLNRFNDFFIPLCKKFYGTDSLWSDDTYLHKLNFVDNCAFIYLNSSLTCIDSDADNSLVIGTKDLKSQLDILKKRLDRIERVFILAHHPLQNLNNDEEQSLEQILKVLSPDNKPFWICGNAHSTRDNGDREYANLLQIGSLTGAVSTTPNFAIYDFFTTKTKYGNEKRVEIQKYFFNSHLNLGSEQPGGWKREYNFGLTHKIKFP